MTWNLIPDDHKQALRLKRNLISNLAVLLFSLTCLYFYTKNYFVINDISLIFAFIALWLGQLTFTIIIISNFNLNFNDPSMTLYQMIWATTFLLFFSYALVDMRDIMLISYMGILSFGFFKLTPKQFIIHVVITLLSYLFIIIYIYINEPLRIRIERELLQFIVFSITCAILVYTGSEVSRLRGSNHIRTQELKDAVHLNRLLAITDDLTGLHTRSYMMDIMEQQKALADRENNDFIVLFADLDHFKQINDTYGHSAGDIVLEDFSNIITTSIREVDYASRFGGEEFVMVLINTDMNQAKRVAERIRESTQTHNFNDVAPGLSVTVSIGAACYQEFKSIQETLQQADKRMYKAKETGRNKCIFS